METSAAAAERLRGFVERHLGLIPLENITMPSPSAPPPPPAPPGPPPESAPLDAHVMGALAVGLSILLLCSLCFVCRVWRRNRYYSKVQRTLDEEERAFQECTCNGTPTQPES